MEEVDPIQIILMKKKMEEKYKKFIVITLRIMEVIEAFTSVHYILELHETSQTSLSKE